MYCSPGEPSSGWLALCAVGEPMRRMGNGWGSPPAKPVYAISNKMSPRPGGLLEKYRGVTWATDSRPAARGARHHVMWHNGHLLYHGRQGLTEGKGRQAARNPGTSMLA